MRAFFSGEMTYCFIACLLNLPVLTVSVHVGAKNPGFLHRKASLAVEKHLCKQYYFARGAPKTRFLVYPLD